LKALGKFVVVELVKEEEKITRAGIVLASTGENVTTNSGDKVGTAHKNIVREIGPDVKLDIHPGDEVVVNPWALQLFEIETTAYGVIPEEEIKVVK